MSHTTQDSRWSKQQTKGPEDRVCLLHPRREEERIVECSETARE